MVVHKTGRDSVVFTVSSETIGKSGTRVLRESETDEIQELARRAMHAQGIESSGPIKLQAFTAGGETLVFASRAVGGVLYRFLSLDDVMDAAASLGGICVPDASLHEYEGTYYLHLDGGAEQRRIAALLGEYAAADVFSCDEVRRVIKKGRLIAHDALHRLAAR